MEFGRPDGREVEGADDRKESVVRDSAEFRRPQGILPESLFRGGLEDSFEINDDDDEDDDDNIDSKKNRKRRFLSLVESSDNKTTPFRRLFADQPNQTQDGVAGGYEYNRAMGTHDETILPSHSTVGNQIESDFRDANVTNWVTSDSLPRTLEPNLPVEQNPMLTGDHGNAVPEENLSDNIRTFVRTSSYDLDSSQYPTTAEERGNVGPKTYDEAQLSTEVYPQNVAAVDSAQAGSMSSEVIAKHSQEVLLARPRSAEVMTVGSGLLATIGVEAGLRHLGVRKSQVHARDLNRQNHSTATHVAEPRLTNLAAKRQDELPDKERDQFEHSAAQLFEQQHDRLASRPHDSAPAKKHIAPQPTQRLGSIELGRAQQQDLDDAPNRTQLAPMAAETDKPAGLNSRSDSNIEQIRVTAEHDGMTEVAYERGQEIKDEPTSVSSGVSGGNDSVNHHLQRPHATWTQKPSEFDFKTSHNIKPIDDQLQGAAKNGVLGAVLILIFILIAYLLLH